jgi:WD40 repeat protein
LWNVASGRAVRQLKGHTAPVSSVAFSPDGKSLASGWTDMPMSGPDLTDTAVRLWDVASGRELRRIDGRTSLDFHGGELI